MILIKHWHYKFFILILALFTACLVGVADSLSISYKEALTFYEEQNALHYLMHLSTSLFGQTSLALRVPFLIFYVLSVVLMFQMTNNYFKSEKDRLISIAIFMCLPGIVGASLLVNNSILVIFCTVLYLYRYKVTG
jgi:4-amino-4-deoxy-L-arabinose transferase-like glycosyltransferase